MVDLRLSELACFPLHRTGHLIIDKILSWLNMSFFFFFSKKLGTVVVRDNCCSGQFRRGSLFGAIDLSRFTILCRYRYPPSLPRYLFRYTLTINNWTLLLEYKQLILYLTSRRNFTHEFISFYFILLISLFYGLLPITMF